MHQPADLPEYLERCLRAASPNALRHAALELPGAIPGEVAWLVELDREGRRRAWAPALAPELRSAYETGRGDDPLLPPEGCEPRALSRTGAADAFARSDLAARFHGPLGLRDVLMIPLSPRPPVTALMLGRRERDFDDDDLASAGVIQAVLSAAFARALRRAPLETAHRVARQELRTHARTLVLLVDADGTLHGDGVDRLSPEARREVEDVIGSGPTGEAAGAAREIMLVRNASEAATGLMSLKILPPDEGGVSCVLVRLPADAAHLEEHGLSSRQAQVMALVLAGLDAAEISRRLAISPATVRKHTENAYRTLGVRSLTEFALRVL